MKPILVRLVLAACCFLAAGLQAQQSTAPAYAQTIFYIKAAPGKDAEWIQFVDETFSRIAQVQANAGEIVSWTFLRAISPAGQEARADFAISIITQGAPIEPMSGPGFVAAMEKAGVAMSLEQFLAKRNALGMLVNTEMYRIRARVGAAQKGHYLLVNQMKVLDAEAHADHEQNIQPALVEAWIKQGAMSGWLYATRMLTVGTETVYRAYTVDMFPTWQAVFAPRKNVFEQVHPGKNLQEIATKVEKAREIGRRDLWVVVERVEKST